MRRIIVTGVPPLEIQDFSGPLQVFSQCDGYSVEIVSPERDGSLATNFGLKVDGGVSFRKVSGPVDTLWMVGGPDAPSGTYPADYMRWLQEMCRDARRVGASCLGTFVLAATGILDGKRAVTHWQWSDRLAQRYPAVRVERGPIFMRDGKAYTSAGITTGIDLALALVEEDFGRRRAMTIAQWLVLYARRTGTQAQLSRLLLSQARSTDKFDKLQEWIVEHLHEQITLDAMANVAGMSTRNFARVFRQEKGVTPARWVEELRVETAARLLEVTKTPAKTIANECGFGSADSMRRSFLRILGVGPRDYERGLTEGDTQRQPTP
jgi:transcriptional regulator GlxA family with amidase domain